MENGKWDSERRGEGERRRERRKGTGFYSAQLVCVCVDLI